MVSCADRLEIHGDLRAKVLANRLGARWVAPHDNPIQADAPITLFWGPIGWATRAATGAAGVTIWRWSDPGVPLTAAARWALKRFDHVVVGDPVCAELALGAGAAGVTTIGRAGGVSAEATSEPRAMPTIGWLSEGHEGSPFELFLLVRRLRAGAVGICSRCQAPRVGDFDPWRSSVKPPSCCGDINLLAPITARVEFAGPADSDLALQCDRLIEWLGLDDAAFVELAPPTDPHENFSIVSRWSVQVSFDERPELPRSLIASAVSGVPFVGPRFAAMADLENPASVRARTRLTPTGAVRASPDQAQAAVRVHELLSDPTLYQRAVQALRPIAAAHSPARVDDQWHQLVNQLHPD